VVGITAGVWGACRLSRRARHFYAPSLPALVNPGQGDRALETWGTYLRESGAAEAVFDSFDARWRPASATDGEPSPDRVEYLVPIDVDPAAQTARCADTHRRHIRRGEREGWRILQLEGADGLRALDSVRATAAERATLRGNGFSVAPLEVRVASPEVRAASGWGAETYGAWAGETLLAAALVGWANRRAFYIMGGSSPDGYRCSAAVWLHWKIMHQLAARGCSVYNLGGTLPGANDPASPSNGLYRFKTSFGADCVTRRGTRWQFHRLHLAVHSFARAVTARFARGGLS